MREKAIGTKLLLAAVTLGVLAYFAMQGFNYFHDPLTTTLAYTYQVEQSVSLSGYVARQEQVLTGDAGGLLRLQREEGERVSAGGVVATVYADQASLDRQTEIDTLQNRLEQLQYAQEAAVGTEVSLKLDAQIMQSVLDMRGYLAADRLDKAEDYGGDLRSLVLKRDYTYTDTEDLTGQIQELQTQIRTLRNQAATSTRRITAPAAGLYSAVVDGYEQVLTPDSLASLTPATLAALRPDSAVQSEIGKLVLGDEWYFAAAMKEDEAAALAQGGALTLRFAKSVERDLPVTLVSVSKAENGRVAAVLQGKTYLPELTLLRQQSAEVVVDTLEGIRVPKEALRGNKTTVNGDGEKTVTEETGVYCLMGKEARFKPVTILYNGEGFALVRAASTADKTMLRTGDEVIITAHDLFDGKVMG